MSIFESALCLALPLPSGCPQACEGERECNGEQMFKNRARQVFHDFVYDDRGLPSRSIFDIARSCAHSNDLRERAPSDTEPRKIEGLYL